MNSQAKTLMRAKDLAELLGVSIRQIWRLRSAGELPQPVRIAGSVRWDPEDIEKFIAAAKGGRV